MYWTTIPSATVPPALIVPRTVRDRIAIFDPRCAPLMQPLLSTVDLQAWHTPTGANWVIIASADPPARLAQYLASVAPTEAHDGWWFYTPLVLPPPRLIIAGTTAPVVAWDETHAVIAGPALVLAQAEPFWLALLGSAPGQQWLQHEDRVSRVADLAALSLPIPTREQLGALAIQRVGLARDQYRADAEYARRLLADFGPPGVHLSPRLEQWWELDATALFTALETDLRNGVPLGFQPFYAQRHTEALAARQALEVQIGAVQGRLDELADGLIG